MYQLLINTNIENPTRRLMDRWEEVELGNATIALTYQANDLAELKSREANRSNRIKLPRTAKNNRLFKLPSEPLSVTVAPYRYFDCRLYDNGVELFSTGAKLQLMDTTSTSYEVCIRGSLFDFFEKIKSLSLRDLNLGTTAWTLQSVADSDIDSNVLFPVIDWDENSPSLHFKGGTMDDNESRQPLEILARYILPAVKLRYLCEKICEEQEYKLKLPKEVEEDDKYRYAVIPHVTADFTEEERNTICAGRIYGGKNTFGDAEDNEYYAFNAWEGCFDNPTNRYLFPFRGQYIYHYTIEIEEIPQSRSISIYYEYGKRRGEQVVEVLQGIRPGVHSGFFAIDHNLEDHHAAVMGVRVDTGKGHMIIKNAELRFEKVSSAEPVFPASVLSVSAHLPDIPQLDLLKLLAQLWCLSVAVDEEKKEVVFYSFNLLYENLQKGNVLDWTDKLDDSEHRSSFRWNTYARENLIRYEEDEGEGGAAISSEGVLCIDDHTLPQRKDLVVLPVSACEETVVADDLLMAKVRAISQGGTAGMADAKPKLLYVKQLGRDVQFTNSISRPLSRSSITLAQFGPVTIDQFMPCYKVLQNRLLAGSRVIKEMLRLNSIDIQIFSHAMPVFLGKYGCCFYVNKLNNYQPGRLTEVELVAMRP